jgi:hypothetical protein
MATEPTLTNSVGPLATVIGNSLTAGYADGGCRTVS